jgi:hypothetical protein
MTDHENNHDGHDHDPDNPIAPAASAGAMVSLEALGAALSAVDTATIAGHSARPMLQFKREGGGTWAHGQRRTVVEDGSRWAADPRSFMRGYICFGDGNKRLGERLLSVTLPMTDPTGLPDHGFPWVEQWAVCLKCLDGADAGLEVVYKPTTVGGLQAVVGLLETVRDRLAGKMHDGKVSPIVHLGKYDWNSPQYGRIWAPLFDLVAWMSLDGPAPAPAPATPPPPTSPPPSAAAAEQPRRRRVG